MFYLQVLQEQGFGIWVLRGFSTAVMHGGVDAIGALVSVYLSEIATPGHKGFYVAWQSASQQLAVVFAALLGVALSSTLTTQQMTDWGWRVPLWIGCFIIPFLFVIRPERIGWLIMPLNFQVFASFMFAPREAALAQQCVAAISAAAIANWSFAVGAVSRGRPVGAFAGRAGI